MRRVGQAFAACAVVALALSIWMIAADRRRPWMPYQQTWREEIDPWMANARAAQRSLLGRPPAFDATATSEGTGPTGLEVASLEPPELTVDRHFARTPRVDRCATCHAGIAATDAKKNVVPPWRIDGTGDERSVERALRGLDRRTVEPAWPRSGQCEISLPRADQTNRSLWESYGFALVDSEARGRAAATVVAIAPDSPAARAGLQVGDVVQAVGDERIRAADAVETMLRRTGRPAVSGDLQMKIERGLPHPYCAHPRLDLFVGEESPHPASRFGCTICHGGEGAAVDFTRTGHRPDDPAREKAWRAAHQWRPLATGGEPMRPARFIESGCLLCHADVTALQASREFPDSAPKLARGLRLIRENGCFGCHTFDATENRGNGPGRGLTLETGYHEAAAQLLATAALDEEEQRLAARLVHRPRDASLRERLVRRLREHSQAGARADVDRLLALLATQPPGDHAARGPLPKVGPSLRHVAEKLDRQSITAWIAEPTALRPQTRMPSFFGLHAHLEGETLEETRTLETAEIEAVAAYLLSVSQPLVSAERSPEEETFIEEGCIAGGPIDRGRKTFFESGCAACHETPHHTDRQATHGPDLAGTGDRLDSLRGRRWLLDWLAAPSDYSPRTTMPRPVWKATDEPKSAALDVAAYLSSLKTTEQPRLAPEPFSASEVDRLFAMIERLGGSIETGTTDDQIAAGSSPDAARLAGVGRAMIGRRGCYGCHDIPGFAEAQPIGPPLAGWGRKREDLLGFERVDEFLQRPDQQASLQRDESPADSGFFQNALRRQRREGFLWQKLRAPRSFDYEVAASKAYPARLTMGRFRFTPDQREAILTYILGLTGDSPPAACIDNPDPRRATVARGRDTITRLGCDQCHLMDPARWTFRYDPALWRDPIETPQFAALRPVFTREERLASQAIDRAGRGLARIAGRPVLDALGKRLAREDADGGAAFAFSLWEPAMINGRLWQVGTQDVPVRGHRITAEQPAWGGPFATRLFLQLTSREGDRLPERWGWCPPPLVREGEAVQTDWIASYLLSPSAIRPACVLRMPCYRLDDAEVQTLVDYFAATAGPRFAASHTPIETEQPTAEHLDRWNAAYRLLTDRTTFCAKCHAVGAIEPSGGEGASLAPNLAGVGRRMHKDYLRRWIAAPQTVLPYTAMPVHFPPEGPPVGQDLLPGSSTAQIDAVVDLLLHLDLYLRASSDRATKDRWQTPPDGS